MSCMANAWKNAHPNPKPSTYSSRKSGQKDSASPAAMAAPDHDADPIARDAMHGRPEDLTPTGRDVLLVGAPTSGSRQPRT